MLGISVLVKPVSGLCNMHCDYCFYRDESAKRAVASYGVMSKETLRNVIRRTLLQAEKGYTLAFQGGEPTLAGIDFYREALEYVRQYNKNGAQLRLALQTNGAAIDENWAQFLAMNHFLVGLSVDGLPGIHEKYRHLNGASESTSAGAEAPMGSAASTAPAAPDPALTSYDAVRRASSLFDLYGVDYNILTVVHREVAQNIKEIYRAYKDRGWKFLQFIQCLDPLGESRGQEEYSLTPADYGQFLIDLFDLWYADLQKGEQPYIRQFENYLGILLGYQPEACEQRGYCDLQFVVEADGGVYPCDFYVLESERIGNFNEDRLPAILERGAELPRMQASRAVPEACRDCAYFRLCRNGCYRCRNTEAGEDGMSYYCESYKRFFSERGEALKAAADLVLSRRS